MNEKIKIKKDKILVTGAGGFIGSHLCESLLKKNYKVFGLIHNSKEKIRHLEKNPNFKLINEDITNFNGMFRVFKRIKPCAVFHAAAFIPEKENANWNKIFKTNVMGTLNILEAAKLNKVKIMIYSSSMSVYGKNIKYLPVDENHPLNPANFYGLSKWQAEKLCEFYAEKCDMNIIILRYSGVYGSRRNDGSIANFIRDALQNKPLKILDNVNWDIVYVNDIVGANIRAYERATELKFEIINIGSGKKINLKKLADKIVKISGSRSKIKFGKFFSRLPSFNFYYNIVKAKKLLKFTPMESDTALNKFINYFKSVSESKQIII